MKVTWCKEESKKTKHLCCALFQRV